MIHDDASICRDGSTGESNAKASDFIQGTDTRCAFVSINSIRQGEQVAPLWQRMNATVDFACRKVWGPSELLG